MNAKIRSSRPGLFFKKGVLKNFAKLAGKYLSQNLFFNKVSGQACIFTKKETLAKVFSCEFCEIFRNIFFIEQFRLRASVKSGTLLLRGVFRTLTNIYDIINYTTKIINCMTKIMND